MKDPDRTSLPSKLPKKHLSLLYNLAEAVIQKYGAIFSAVMQYGGNFFGGKRFFVFRRQRKRKFKSWRYLRCLASYMHTFLAPEETATFSRRLPLCVPFARLVCLTISREKSRQNQHAKLRLPLFIMNKTEQPHVKRTNKKSTLNRNNSRMP